MAIIKELKEGDHNLENCFEGAEKVLELDASTDFDQVEEFFKDSDDEIDMEGPTEAQKIMFKEDVDRFKHDVAKEREKYQPTTTEKIFAVVKSVILRALAFYIIMWFMRRNSTPGGIPSESKSESIDENEFISDSPNGVNDEL